MHTNLQIVGFFFIFFLGGVTEINQHQYSDVNLCSKDFSFGDFKIYLILRSRTSIFCIYPSVIYRFQREYLNTSEICMITRDLQVSVGSMLFRYNSSSGLQRQLVFQKKLSKIWESSPDKSILNQTKSRPTPADPDEPITKEIILECMTGAFPAGITGEERYIKIQLYLCVFSTIICCYITTHLQFAESEFQRSKDSNLEYKKKIRKSEVHIFRIYYFVRFVLLFLQNSRSYIIKYESQIISLCLKRGNMCFG